MSAADNGVGHELWNLDPIDRGYAYGHHRGYDEGWTDGHRAGFFAGIAHADALAESDWSAMREHVHAIAKGAPYAELAEIRGQHHRAAAQRLILTERGLA